MLRAAMLTFRMHRFEVLTALLVMTLVGLIALLVLGQLNAVGVPPECFEREGSPACRASLESFYSIRNDQANWLLGTGAGLLPLVVGLVLGVPLVGREIEMRTTALAWSLAGDRKRWLLQRFIPMLAVALIGLSILAVIETALLQATRPGLLTPELDHLGTQGPTFVARGLMALGLGLLAGAVIGRTLPAFLLAGMLVVGIALVGGAALHSTLARHYAVWSDVDPATDQSGDFFIDLEERYRDRSGRVISWDEVEQLRSSHEPNSDQWLEENLIRMRLAVPDAAFPQFELIETGLGLAVAGLSTLLTFPVVTRRRTA